MQVKESMKIKSIVLFCFSFIPLIPRESGDVLSFDHACPQASQMCCERSPDKSILSTNEKSVVELMSEENLSKLDSKQYSRFYFFAKVDQSFCIWAKKWRC